MNTVYELTNAIRGAAEAAGLSYIYGELWQLNEGAERDYPLVLTEPLDSRFPDITKEHEMYPVRMWVIDQLRVTDDRSREQIEDVLRGYGIAIVTAIRDSSTLNTWMHFSQKEVRITTYANQLSGDNVVALKYEWQMQVHNCDVL